MVHSSIHASNHLSDPENVDAVYQTALQAICERQLIFSVNDHEDSGDKIALVENLATSTDAVPDSYEQGDQFGGLPVIPHLTDAELRDKQRADQCIKCHFPN